MREHAIGANAKKIMAALLSAIVIIVACVSLVTVSASATPLSDKKAEAKAAKEKLDEMQTKLDEASDTYYEALEAHDEAVANMDETQAKIDDLEEQIAESQQELEDRAVMMYRNGQTSMMDVLLGSASYKDFATSWNLLNSLNDDTADIIQTNKDLKAEAEDLYAQYQEQEQVAADKLDEAEEAKSEAEALVEQYQDEVDSLDAEVAELIEEQEKAQEEAAKQSWNSSNSSSSSSSSSSGAEVPSNLSGNAIVSAAYSKLGCPYVWGATGPNSFDCSGLTSWCYRQAGISIPRTSGAQHNAGTVISLSDAEPGDILWMPGHVGIYIGDGAYIHAPQPGDVVKISHYMSMWSCAVRF